MKAVGYTNNSGVWVFLAALVDFSTGYQTFGSRPQPSLNYDTPARMYSRNMSRDEVWRVAVLMCGAWKWAKC
jgi:hypothetical protein